MNFGDSLSLTICTKELISLILQLLRKFVYLRKLTDSLFSIQIQIRKLFTFSIILCSLRNFTCLTRALDFEMNSCLWISIASCKEAFSHAFWASLLVESRAFRVRGTLRSVKTGQYLWKRKFNFFHIKSFKSVNLKKRPSIQTFMAATY